MTFPVLLREAGRKVSKKNETALRAAVDYLLSVLSQLNGDDDSDEAKEARTALEALTQPIRQLLEAEFSHSDKHTLVMGAIRAKYPTADMWITDMFDAYVIVHHWGTRGEDGVIVKPRVNKLYKFEYTVADDGTVTLGEPVEVRLERNYVPVNQSQVSEAGATVQGIVVPLIERSVRTDGTIPIKVIQAGWGSSGYYPESVLKRDGPKVFKNGLHMHWNHPTATESYERPERDLSTLAGVLVSDARWDDKGTAGPGLYANAKVFGDYKESMDELAPHIGVSIYASGIAKQGEAEGRQGTIIEKLTDAQSVDFVTVPGAGGKVLELFESAGRKSHSPALETALFDAKGASVKIQGKAKASSDVDTLTVEGKVTVEGDELKTLQDEVRGLREANARMAEAQMIRDARDVATIALAKVDLPDVTRARVIESLAKNPPVKDGALDKEALKVAAKEAADKEIAYLAEAAGYGSGRIVGMGGGSPWEDAGAGDDKSVLEAQARLEGAFGTIGLSETAAKAAATGRR